MRTPGAIALDTTDLRYAAAAGVGAGVALPLLPIHLPFACPLRTATGVPCPLCGMTTSVTETIRFDLEAAFAATPAGVAAVAVAVLVLLLRPRRVSIPAPLPYLVLGCMWLYQLYRFSFL